MRNACECGMALVEVRPLACHECGTACCRSCALEVGTQTLCRWCATAPVAARA